MDRIIGIGEYAISANENDVIKTFALASCIAVTVYSSLRKVAGMIHIALPNPTNEEAGIIRPGYYAATGMPILINKLCKDYGCLRGELKIHLFGGAKSVKKGDVFNIGERNTEAVKNILGEMNLNYSAKEIGGTFSRTIEMYVSTGVINVFTQPLII